MTLTRLALSYPVAAVVAVLLVLLFGTIALVELPVQMIPSVVIPRITIEKPWRAAAPEDFGDLIEVEGDLASDDTIVRLRLSDRSRTSVTPHPVSCLPRTPSRRFRRQGRRRLPDSAPFRRSRRSLQR